MTYILVTGFTPFKGRQVNGSWTAASSLPDRYRGFRVEKVELPVIWGAPAEAFDLICKTEEPAIILSMGEGRAGWFDIETVARNRRGRRKDNAGALPSSPLIRNEGPANLGATIDAAPIRQALVAAGYPVRISRNAGGFLCEETLYTLESLKGARPGIAVALFVHLPPYGTALEVAGRSCTCDEGVLTPFAATLLDLVVATFESQSPER